MRPYESRISATSCRTDKWCDPVRRKTSWISRPSDGTTSRLIESVPRPLQKRLWQDPFIGVDLHVRTPPRDELLGAPGDGQAPLRLVAVHPACRIVLLPPSLH